MKIKEELKSIFDVIEQAGGNAYLVGGCVRDFYLQKESVDIDICTDLLPETIKKIFKKTVDTGIKHGTVTVWVNHQPYEITTMRKDGIYKDHRHPEDVEYTTDIKEDLQRRDFTINAMAYSPRSGLIDLFHGRLDLDKRIVKAVGKADDRFNEDALRMLRAVRFCAQLNFQIEEKTYQSICKNFTLLQYISAERVKEELDKILCSDHPEKIEILFMTGLHQVIFEKLSYDPDSIFRLRYLPLHLGLRYAFLWRSLNLDEAKKQLKRLKFDNKTKELVCFLIEHKEIQFPMAKSEIKKFLYAYGDVYVLALLDFLEALGGNHTMDQIRKNIQEIKTDNDCVDLKDLAVRGGDLIELGYQKGRQIGEILEYLLWNVHQNPQDNKKELLLQKALSQFSLKRF